MKRSDKLKPVLHYSELKQKDAAKNLGKHVRLLEENQKRLRDLELYRAEYAQRYQQKGEKGIQAADLRDYQAFMKKLDDAIQHQQQIIQQTKKNQELAKRQWLAARGKTKAMDTVISHYQKSEEAVQEKAVQRELDDGAASKIVKRNKN